MNITGDNTNYSQTPNITGENNLYGNITSDTLTCDTLVVTSLAEVPFVTPLGDYSNKAVNTQYLADYFNAHLHQDPYFQFPLGATIGYISPTIIHNYLSTNTQSIRMPDETLLPTVGFRYIIYPDRAWSSLYVSVPITTVTGSTFVFNGQIVSSITMNANNSFLEIMCINLDGTGVCWTVLRKDPNSLLSSNNTFSGNNTYTGSNTFSKLTYNNVSSAITLTNPDFTSPSYSNINQLIYTGTTSSSTYSISGWNYTQDAGTLNLYINNNSYTPFYTVNYPTASNNASVIQYNPTTFGNRAYCRSILYSLIAGEYELIFYLQTNFNQSPPLSVDVSIESFGVTQGAIKNITPAQSYPEWVQYKIGFNLSTTTNCQIQISQAEGYCMYSGFSLTLTNAINVTDGTILSSIGAKQSLLNDLYVKNSLTVSSGGIVCVGGLTSGSTFGTSNTLLNSRMGATSSLVNNSSISIGLGAGNSLNGGIRNILMGDYTGLSATLTESILIGFFQGGMGNSSNSNVCIGNRIMAHSGPYGENSLVGNGIGSIFQGGGVGYRNAVVGASCFNKYAGFGGVNPSYCAVVGYKSNFNNGSSFNSALGSETLYNITGLNTGTLTQYNTAIGYRAGYAYDGLNNCSFLGAFADTTVANLTNATAIGYNCKVASSNTIQLGSNGEAVNITGALTTGEYVIVGTNLTVNFDANINVNLTVDGFSYLNNVDIAGNITVNGFSYLNNVDIAGTITVDGFSYLNNVDIAGTITTTNGIVDLITDQPILGNKAFRSLLPLAGNMTIPIDLGTINTFSMGYGSLGMCAADAASTALISIGNNCFGGQNASFSGCVSVGASSFLASTNLGNYNTSIGNSAGFTYSQTGTNNTLVGAFTDFNASSSFSNSTALGYGSIITASNQIVCGRITETVCVRGILQVQNKNIERASPTLITTTITLSGVLNRYYSVTSAAAYSITLPAASVGYMGSAITFRRVGATITNAITSASANIFPLNSITAATTLLAASTCQVTICCMLITAAPTYGWVVID
jgi:hypothetical protein